MKQILLLLFFSVLLNQVYSQKEFNCELYKNGYFTYLGDYDNFIILRDGKYQIEIDLKANKWVAVEILWGSDCSYSFIYLNTNIQELKDDIGTERKVTIVAGDNTGYFYNSVFPTTGDDTKGRINFLTTPLSAKQDKKVRKKLEKTSAKN